MANEKKGIYDITTGIEVTNADATYAVKAGIAGGQTIYGGTLAAEGETARFRNSVGYDEGFDISEGGIINATRSDYEDGVLSDNHIPNRKFVMETHPKGLPLVVAYNSADLLNITGDDTVYTIPFNTTDVNVGTAYNTTTGVFTAGVTGIYSAFINIFMDGLWTAHTEEIVQIVRAGDSAANWNLIDADLLDIRFNIVGGFGDVILTGYQEFYMVANDTAEFQFTVMGTSKIVDVLQGSNCAIHLVAPV